MTTPRRHRGPAQWRSSLREWRPSLGAEYFLVAYLFCLLLIPSRLVVRQLGAVGTPASLVALAALMWWGLTTVGGLNRTRGLTATRLGIGAAGVAVIASYAAGLAGGWWAPPGLRQATDEDWTLLPVEPHEVTSAMISAADRGLIAFLGWAGILLLTAEGLGSSRAVDVVTTWLSRFAAVVAALAVAQYYLHVDIAALISIPGLGADVPIGEIDSRSVVNRVSSTARHPIELGVVMAVTFFVALHRAVFSRNLLTWTPVVLIGLALPMSVSRSALLALGLGGFVVLVSWPRRWRRRALLILPVAAVLVRLAAPGLMGTIRALFLNVGNDPSIAGRTADYGPVLSLYAESPIFGRGLFTFVPRYYRIIDNQALMFLVELGIFGLLAVVLMNAAALSEVRLVHTVSPVLEQRLLAAVLGGCIISILGSYAMFDAWGFPMLAGLSFLLLGLCGAVAANERSRSRAVGFRGGPDRTSARMASTGAPS